MASEIAIQDENSRATTSIREKFKDQIDWDEFKSRTVAQVMQCHAGKAPLDYYLAELAVEMWMQNFEKNPEELEEYIRSTPMLERAASCQGEISVIDTADEVIDSPPGPVSRSYKEVLLSNLPTEEDLHEPPRANSFSPEEA